VDNLRDADQKITYILDGTEQILEPHFTFQGFRYIKITGDAVTINDDDLTAIALYSDMKPTGKFSTSDPLINQLQQNIQWGQKGNFLDVPTDCPQRDERLGWTGDAQAFFNTAAYNMNVNNFFSKWMKDVATDQLESGAVPHVVPNVLGENASGSAGWADAATIIPWNSYLLYGDHRMLQTQYPSMKSWVDYIVNQSQDNLWASGFHFGDWLFYRPDDDNDGRAAITDKYYITQCFFANSTQLVINAAKVLGHVADVKKYQALLKDIKKAFQNEFVTNSGRVGPNTQTAYVLALQFDMLPESQREQAVDRLVDNIKRYGYHLTTGFLGTPYLCHVLSRFGREDMAYELLMQDAYPSWLYPVTMGATTIWERWDGIKPDGSFQTPGMNSYNHYAYGAIGEWMYQNIAGINADSSAPGYKRIKIKSILGGGLTEASGSLETYYGTIKSAWKYEGTVLKQKITVPVNTRAEVYLLSEDYTQIREGKKPIESQKLIEFLGSEAGYSKVLLGSGSYEFSIPIEENLASNRLNKIIGDYTAFTGFGSDFSVINEGEKLYIVLKENKVELIPKGEDTYVFASNPEYTFKIQRSRAQSIRSVRVEIGEMSYNAAKD
jgi:alpha-L-rhamnosidase